MPIPLSQKQVDYLGTKGIKVSVGDIYDEASGNVIPAQVQAAAVPVPASEAPVDLGLVKRQVISSAIPAATGGVGAGIASGAVAGLGGGPVGSGIGAVVGGALAAYGAKKLQDKLLRSYAEANPTSPTATFVKQAEQDVREHPYISSAAALPSSILAGGSALPSVKNIIASPARAAGIGAIQAGTDIATQKAVNPEQPVDWGQVAISGLGGPLFAGKGHNAPSRTVSSGEPAGDLASLRAKLGATASPATEFPASIEDLLAADPKTIKFMADNLSGHDAAVASAIYKLRTTPGFNLTPGHIQDLMASSPATIKKTLGTIIGKDVLPASVAGQENKVEAPALAAGEKAREAEILSANEAEKRAEEQRLAREKDATTIETENQAAATQKATQLAADAEARNRELINQAKVSQVPAPEDRVTGVTEKGITQPATTGAAESSAKVIAAAEPKDLDAAIAAHDAENSRLNKIEDKITEYPEGSPERTNAINYLARARSAADENLRAAFAKAGTPEAKPGVGVEEAVHPRQVEPVEPPKEDETGTETNPPVAPPELPTKAPGETLPGGPAAGAGKTVPNAVPDKGNTPAATSLEAIKKALGVDVKPEQKPAAEKVGPVQGFSNALGVMGAGGDGQRARKLLASHQSLIGKKFTSVDEMRKAFEALPAGDKLRMATLYDAGAESYVPKLAEAKSPAARIAKALSVPGEKKTTPAPEKGGQPAQQEPFQGGAGEVEKRYSGIPAEVVKKTNPIEFLAGSEHALKPSFKVAEAAHETLGPRFVNAVNKAEIDRTAFMNNVEKQVGGITKGLSDAESRQVSRYLYDRLYGNKPEDLSPRLQAVADKASAFVKSIIPPDAPFVSEIVNGKVVERPREEVPNFWPQIVNREALKVLRGKNTEESRALREAQIAHNAAYGNGDYEAATREFTSKFAPAEGVSGLSPEFAGLRRPAGKGLAAPLREMDLRKTLMTYGQRIATDYAWHKNIESDPALAKGLNLPSNGKGEATPEVVHDEKGAPVEPGILSQNAGVRAVNREYTGTIDPEAREFEKIRNIATAPLLGPVSRGRHVLIAHNALREIMTPEENKLFIESGKKLFDDFEGAKQQALASGSLRASRNINPAQASDMLDGVSNALERFSRLTGAEQTSQAGMVFIDQTARMLAKKRIAEGDTAFLDKFGPNDWRTKGSADEIVNHIAANLTRQSWGTYTGKDLPEWLTRGST